MSLTDRQITAIARTVVMKHYQWVETLGGVDQMLAIKHTPNINLVEDMPHMMQINFFTENGYAEKTVTTIVEEFKSKSNTNNKHE